MLPSLTSNDRDRNNLSSLANILAGIGGGISGLMVPIFTTGEYAIGGSAITGFTVMAAIIGCCFIGCQVMTSVCVKEKPLPPASDEKVGLKQMFGVIFKNKQLLVIALVMICYNLGSSLYYASTTNFLYFRFGYKGTNAGLFGTIGGLLGGVTIFYPLFAKRFTRRTISIFGIATAVVGYALMFTIGATTVNANNPTAIYICLVLCAALVTMGQTMFYMVQTVSIANTIEYNEYQTGSRDEGIIFSVRPFMAKMGSALVVLFQLVIYSALGVASITNGISDLENSATSVIATYKESSEVVAMDSEFYNILVDASGTTYNEIVNAARAAGETVPSFTDAISEMKNIGADSLLSSVSSGTKVWMLFGMTIIPAVFVVVGLIIWLKYYKIDEKYYSEMVQELAVRHEQKAKDEEAAEAERNSVSTDSASEDTASIDEDSPAEDTPEETPEE